MYKEVIITISDADMWTTRQSPRLPTHNKRLFLDHPLELRVYKF